MGYPWYTDANELSISSYTSLVPRQMLEEADRVRATAHLFQEFIVKRCDLRVIIIGDDVFAIEIHPLASLFIRVEKTGTGELDGGFLDLTATYMEMHSKGPMPSKHRVDWTQYDARTATRIPLPNIKNLLQNPVYGLLLQCVLPEMRKRYRSRDDQIQLYLLMQDTAVLVEDDEVFVTGEESVGRRFQESLDLYFHLGQPPINEYHVTFQERQAIIAIGDRSFHLPLPFSYSP